MGRELTQHLVQSSFYLKKIIFPKRNRIPVGLGDIPKTTGVELGLEGAQAARALAPAGLTGYGPVPREVRQLPSLYDDHGMRNKKDEQDVCEGNKQISPLETAKKAGGSAGHPVPQHVPTAGDPRHPAALQCRLSQEPASGCAGPQFWF